MTVWRRPPESLSLSDGEVTLLRLDLELPEGAREALHGCLSAEERKRASRFRFDRHRYRYVTSIGQLRILLGSYLGLAGRDVSFRTATRGKPYVAGDPAPLQFNLSHSGDLALVAVARDRELGVDLEQHRASVATGPVAERYFSRQEVASLRALPPEERIEAFFRVWTRKEAFMKATGAGLSYGLSQFTVSVDDPPAILESRREPQDAGTWMLVHLDPAPGYSGALALPAGSVRLRYWHMPAVWAHHG